MKNNKPAQPKPLFQNPFQIEDLQVLDDTTWHEVAENKAFGVEIPELALSLQGANPSLRRRILQRLPAAKIQMFKQALQQNASIQEINAARRRVLDKLFWELTYWKTPNLYEELTEGERLHPGIFENLKPDLEGKIVLDAGSGSGRAAFECLRYGARQVYAIEPSLGLLKILSYKLRVRKEAGRIKTLRGRFNNLPFEDHSVDLALACSAFTAEPGQGGEEGLQELLRVTRPGGKVVIIWPRQEDLEWLAERGFEHTVLPLETEMKVQFRSMKSALRCADRFYYHNPAVKAYLRKYNRPEVPFSVLGFNPPRDYCWRKV
jgi:SAM-dependent methyltransferase